MIISENVNLNLDNPSNPILEAKIPIYVVREEEYTSSVKFNTPKEYLFETVEKSFNLSLSSNWVTHRYKISSLDVESFRQEISHKYRVKKKCISFMDYYKYRSNKVYYFIGSIFIVIHER